LLRSRINKSEELVTHASLKIHRRSSKNAVRASTGDITLIKHIINHSKDLQTFTNGTTAVDLVSSPASSTQRLVEYLNVYNGDTQANEVTVRFSDNGTFYTIFKSKLAPSDKLEYKDKSGFSVITNSGSVRKTQSSLASTNTGTSVSILPNDINFNSTVANSLKNINEVPLGFSVVKGGVYYFRILGFYDSNSTTNGAKIVISVPTLGTSNDSNGYFYWISATTGTWITGWAQTTTLIPAAPSTTSAATSANPFLFDGFISASDNGFATISFGSEEASPSSITLKGNNRLFYHRLI
jgi:hypothetical protein